MSGTHARHRPLTLPPAVGPTPVGLHERPTCPNERAPCDSQGAHCTSGPSEARTSARCPGWRPPRGRLRSPAWTRTDPSKRTSFPTGTLKRPRAPREPLEAASPNTTSHATVGVRRTPNGSRRANAGRRCKSKRTLGSNDGRTICVPLTSTEPSPVVSNACTLTGTDPSATAAYVTPTRGVNVAMPARTEPDRWTPTCPCSRDGVPVTCSSSLATSRPTRTTPVAAYASTTRSPAMRVTTYPPTDSADSVRVPSIVPRSTGPPVHASVANTPALPLAPWSPHVSGRTVSATPVTCMSYVGTCPPARQAAAHAGVAHISCVRRPPPSERKGRPHVARHRR